MSTICIIDVSIFTEIITIPTRYEQHDAIMSQLRKKIELGEIGLPDSATAQGLAELIRGDEKHIGLLRDDLGVDLEIHWGLSTTNDPIQISNEMVWTDLTGCSLAGRSIQAPTCCSIGPPSRKLSASTPATRNARSGAIVSARAIAAMTGAFTNL
jgi:hypothetical protein